MTPDEYAKGRNETPLPRANTGEAEKVEITIDAEIVRKMVEEGVREIEPIGSETTMDLRDKVRQCAGALLDRMAKEAESARAEDVPALAKAAANLIQALFDACML